ncbi:MAG: class I SAM-dependent methyltransferase [Bacteroidota bacterium]
MPPEWFESWFDSPYYKLLYRHRDETEAAAFIKKLLEEIHLEKNARILDMPCGNGRHSVVMASMGYTIVGADLSARNIREAQENKNAQLNFIEHDMRDSLPVEDFDAVMNLFTSLGYFETEEENFSVMQSIAEALKPSGILVIDFFNDVCVEKNLKYADNFQLENIAFTIERKIENKKVLKQIHVKHGEKEFDFEERVQMLELADFEKYYSPFGLVTEKVFGDYQLNPFSKNSERLIIIARKKK